jgi:hypothetical protein
MPFEHDPVNHTCRVMSRVNTERCTNAVHVRWPFDTLRYASRPR